MINGWRQDAEIYIFKMLKCLFILSFWIPYIYIYIYIYIQIQKKEKKKIEVNEYIKDYAGLKYLTLILADKEIYK